jgi:isoleucyl-tRNA synthetase
MGSLYLDITKDRQYTMQADSVGRRSSQTAMHHILEAMVRWIAPILSFTADELWEYLPGKHNESVLLNLWSDVLAPLQQETEFDLSFWNQVFNVREVVAKELENQRNAGNIKGGLTAEISLFVDDSLLTLLSKLEDELKFVLITSKVSLHSLEDKVTEQAVSTSMPNVFITIKAAEHSRCERCWHQVDSVGKNAAHPELCNRCVDNVEGDGEQRLFA